MKKKILTLMFRHETNVFSPHKANRQSFRNLTDLAGEDVLTEFRGLKTEVGAFIDVFGNREDIELIPTVALYSIPCGNVADDVFDYALKYVLDTIRACGGIDGFIIEFHGAMVTESRFDAEGDFLEAVREVIGNEVPIVATLDLHANVTEKMVRYATALIPYEKYPHTDRYETGYTAATILADIIDGKADVRMAYRKISYLLPLLPSESEQLSPVYTLAKILEEDNNALSVRFTHGFFPSDISEMGMSVLVVTNGDGVLAEDIADRLESCIRENIPRFKMDYPELDSVLDEAEQPGELPVVIGDASDNPGAGGFNDSTHILRRILERGIKGAAIATIVDTESVARCVEAGVGATVRLSLGGKTDSQYSGGPIEADVYVKMITDGRYILKGKMSRGMVVNQGTTAVVEIDGNTVIIASVAFQPYDPEVFRSHGITPEDQRILVTKSAVHYKASFADVSRAMHTVALPGYSVPVPEGYRYKYWKGEI